jgi:hypothetical protein
MNDSNASQLLATVMGWKRSEEAQRYIPHLQLLAALKYDQYQRFGPGRRFVESLASWLEQFQQEHKAMALEFVLSRLIFLSDPEMSHLVQIAYPDVIVPERINHVAEELGISSHLVRRITKEERFTELGLKSLYLGLSDGARTNELRRASDGQISNEQIWQAYELGEEKAKSMVGKLGRALKENGLESADAKFNLIWLLDDFSGSGNTYIRFDTKTKKFDGKIRKIYERLNQGDLVDKSHYEVFLLLYVATRQSIDHIEYWSDRFTSERGYKPLRVRVVLPLAKEVSISKEGDSQIEALVNWPNYYDASAYDDNSEVGGSHDLRHGFAHCALPIVLSHNTPNNSLFILWGYDSLKFQGLFPRVSRHGDF